LHQRPRAARVHLFKDPPIAVIPNQLYAGQGHTIMKVYAHASTWLIYLAQFVVLGAWRQMSDVIAQVLVATAVVGAISLVAPSWRFALTFPLAGLALATLSAIYALQ